MDLIEVPIYVLLKFIKYLYPTFANTGELRGILSIPVELYSARTVDGRMYKEKVLTTR